jgi:hypothetical protein
VIARDPLNAADGAALNEQPDNLSDSLNRQVRPVQLFGTVGIDSIALAAAKTLITLAIFPVFLAFDSAIVAGHFGLPFLRDKPIMRLWIGIAASPAC